MTSKTCNENRNSQSMIGATTNFKGLSEDGEAGGIG
jgi:hypothetical protein